LGARFPLAVASSSPPEIIKHVLKEAGIHRCFSVVVSADEVGKGRPGPRQPAQMSAWPALLTEQELLMHFIGPLWPRGDHLPELPAQLL